MLHPSVAKFLNEDAKEHQQAASASSSKDSEALSLSGLRQGFMAARSSCNYDYESKSAANLAPRKS